jgi:hypothetical protein
MERKLTFPDINAIQMTHRIVIEFIDFQESLKESVGFIKPFIIFNTIYVNLYNMIGIISAEFLPKKSLSCLLTLSYTIIISAHNLWILYKVNGKSRIEKKLKINLKRWQKIQFNELCIIELEILERTIEQLLNRHSFVTNM